MTKEQRTQDSHGIGDAVLYCHVALVWEGGFKTYQVVIPLSISADKGDLSAGTGHSEDGLYREW
jgi:hypothetical protein